MRKRCHAIQVMVLNDHKIASGFQAIYSETPTSKSTNLVTTIASMQTYPCQLQVDDDVSNGSIVQPRPIRSGRNLLNLITLNQLGICE